jgi:hypothetical protein
MSDFVHYNSGYSISAVIINLYMNKVNINASVV